MNLDSHDFTSWCIAYVICPIGQRFDLTIAAKQHVLIYVSMPTGVRNTILGGVPR